MHRCFRRSIIITVLFEVSAKQCSGCKGKISKSELCTSTAAELLESFCFRRFNGAKYVFTIFQNTHMSRTWYLLCRRRLDRVDIVFNVCSKAQASKVWYLLCLRRLSRSKCSIKCDSKLRQEKPWYVLCLRRLCQTKYGIYCVLEGLAERIMLYTMFSKARPSKSIVFTMILKEESSKHTEFIMCLKTRPSKWSVLRFFFSKAESCES